MTATPTDAASARAMAVECGRRANEFVAIRQYAKAGKELARARDLTLLAVWYEQTPNSARGFSSAERRVETAPPSPSGTPSGDA